MEAIEKDDLEQLNRLLQNFTGPSLPIQNLVSEEGFTLVHKCVQLNKVKPLEIVLETGK